MKDAWEWYISWWISQHEDNTRIKKNHFHTSVLALNSCRGTKKLHVTELPIHGKFIILCNYMILAILVNELIIKISWFPLWSGGKKKGLSKKIWCLLFSLTHVHKLQYVVLYGLRFVSMIGSNNNKWFY